MLDRTVSGVNLCGEFNEQALGQFNDVVMAQVKKKGAIMLKYTRRIAKETKQSSMLYIHRVVLIGVLCTLILGMSACQKQEVAEKDYIAYIKNNELNFTFLDSIEPKQISSKASKGYESGALSHNNEDGALTRVSKDGKKIIYVDNLVVDSEPNYSIYYREIDNAQMQPVLMAENIMDYTVDKDFTKSVFIEGNHLKQFDFAEKKSEILLENVWTYIVSEDGKRIWSINENNQIYSWEDGGSKELVDEGEDAYFNHYSEDLSVVYYTKDGYLYKKEWGKDPERLFENTQDSAPLRIYPSGEIYYFTTSEESFNPWDYVEDDLIESDKNIQEVDQLPLYPTESDFENKEDYKKELAEFQKELDKREAFWRKSARDDLRRSAKEGKVTRTINRLNYYDGSTSHVISENMLGLGWEVFGSEKKVDRAIICFFENQFSKDKKIKLSDIDQQYVDQVTIVQAIEASFSKAYMVIGKNKSQPLDIRNVYVGDALGTVFELADNQQAIYYFDYGNRKFSDSIGDIYRVAIDKEQFSKPELYDTDVLSDSMFIMQEDQLGYQKDLNESEAEFFINKEKIGKNCYVPKESYDKNHFYIEHYKYTPKGELLEMKLQQSVNGQVTEVADKVYDYYLTESGKLVYLANYDSEKEQGELYLYVKEKAPIKIDDKVSKIIRPNFRSSSWEER